ncbi:uncharacterized protein LOC141590398 [Silene latifolia]|uniref:uncharacterized protein LOC141590398 n=1 Tax=Silene latifolia TaxID=37657 RepID=UPI003D77198C
MHLIELGIVQEHKQALIDAIARLEDASDGESAWFKHYVLKGETIWQATSTISHSWFWKSVITIKDMLVQLAGVNKTAEEVLAECTRHGKFQVSLLYQRIRPKGDDVGWYRAIHDRAVLPKHAVIVILACQNKLYAIDNLQHRGFCFANRCVLCEKEEETTAHLFFACSFSSWVWVAAYRRMGHFDPPNTLPQVLRWFALYNRGAAIGKAMRRCLLACTIYLIWRERNDRIFQDKRTDPQALSQKICYVVSTRMYYLAK